MAMIKAAELERTGSRAVPLHLADVARQAEHIRLAASEQAERIIAEARARAEEIERDAAERAHQRGYREGLDRGMREGSEQGSAEAFREHARRLEDLESGWNRALSSFASHREQLMSEARQDLLRLAIRIAERVVKRTIQADPSVVEDQLVAAIAVALRPSGLRVSVHPEDLSLARGALPRILDRLGRTEGVELVEDAGVSRGSCVVRGAGGEAIDASVETQLERMAQTLIAGSEPGAEGQSGQPDSGTPGR